jgi:uncharacterized protein YlxW (UPF0749 family)
MFAVTIEDNEFDSDQFAHERNLMENLQLEIDRLQKEVKQLKAENNLYSELVKSKNRIIESLESYPNKK